MKKNIFYCEQCNYPVPLKARFCPHCGGRFDMILCPKCGFKDNEEAFRSGCPKCNYGKKTDKNKTTDKQKDPLLIFLLILIAILLIGVFIFLK